MVALGSDILNRRKGIAGNLLNAMADNIAERLAELYKAEGSGCFLEFDLLKPLGEGTFGVVHLARHKTTRRLHAIKEIRNPGRDPIEMQRTLKEVKILEMLREEPNVVTLGHHYWHQQNLLLVFEFVAGDLGKVLDSLATDPQRRPGLPEDEVRSITRQLVSGMAACHAKGILHRDLKPDNLLITAAGTIKIADLGLGIIMHEVPRAPDGSDTLVSLGDGCGTLFYLPPEYVFAGTPYGKPVDVWSIGCVVAELITGEVLR